MRPIAINLVVSKRVWEKMMLSFSVALVLITFGLTCVNTYDYFANKKILRDYQKRLDIIKRQTQKKNEVREKKNVQVNQKSIENKSYMDYLNPIIERNLFSIPSVLTEIEKNKPEKVIINSLIFNDNGNSITISGESKYIASISDFILHMKRSKSFDVDLTKQEFGSPNNILFELTAEWKP